LFLLFCHSREGGPACSVGRNPVLKKNEIPASAGMTKEKFKTTLFHFTIFYFLKQNFLKKRRKEFFIKFSFL
jgi:hypothetical protein